MARRCNRSTCNNVQHNVHQNKFGKVVFTMPYSKVAKSLHIPSIFRTSFDKYPYEIIVGWKVKANTMRKLYCLNWPVHEYA